MARKTNGNTTTNRSKKTGASVPPAAVEVAPEVGKDVRKNTKPSNLVPVNLEEEIRRRAYDLYRERGGHHGSHEADWHRAESEVRSKYKA